MATVVIMPRQGQSVESCIIAKWHKSKGDSVAVGDNLFTYETDKATFEEEAKTAGILLEVYCEEGDDVPCLDNVCVIGNSGEDTSIFNQKTNLPKAETVSEATKPEDTIDGKTPDTVSHIPRQDFQQGIQQNLKEGFIKISPRARNIAEKMGVEYRYAIGTGPNNRIVERDVDTILDSGYAYTKGSSQDYMNGKDFGDGTGIGGRVSAMDFDIAPAIEALADDMVSTSDIEEVKHTNIRKVIAKTMYNSLATTAQLTLHSSFDATTILGYRKLVKGSEEKMGIANITINDIILYAVSRVLPKHKELNAHMLDDKMLLFRNVQLGIAVDMPRGLMVPTLPNANLKSLNQIAIESKELAAMCQQGSINPDKLTGGSFTVTNLGTLGVEYFTPVLNAPQTGILGVGTVVDRVKNVNGELKIYPAMALSLTFDHRAIDGAPAAKFLKDLTESLENFSVMLAV